MIKIFYDLETTGTDPRKHSIHQIAGIIEVDGVIAEKFDLKTRPHPKAIYEPAAMRICGVTEAQLRRYPKMGLVHKVFIKMLEKYISKFDKKDKAHRVGFNNNSFDDVFLGKWFLQNDDDFMMSWFYPDSLDVMTLASQYLLDRRAAMPSFKLKRVAQELGIYASPDELHDAGYDAHLTREIYRIVTGLEIEM